LEADGMLRLMLVSWARIAGLAFRACVPLPGRPERFSLRRAGALAVFLPLFLALQAWQWLGLLLDEVLFRAYRRVTIRPPLFVVGVPRSGTTFLHRALAHDPDLTTFQTWELLLAISVTWRKLFAGLGTLDRWLGRPVARLLGRLERSSFGGFNAIHELSLNEPEEDFIALAPVLGCFLLAIPFPFSERLWRLARFDEAIPEAERRRIMTFYRSCVQRHLYVRGADRRFLSKNPSFTPLIRSLQATFPECRIVACVRDPLAAVPSQLSSIRPGIELFDADRSGEGFRDRFVATLKWYYKRIEAMSTELAENRWATVRMDQLRTDLEATVGELYTRFELNLSDGFVAELVELAESSRRYRSQHRYSLEQFGLQEEALAREFSFDGRRFLLGASARAT
jgi:hypothetical protein